MKIIGPWALGLMPRTENVTIYFNGYGPRILQPGEDCVSQSSIIPLVHSPVPIYIYTLL